MRQTSLQSYNKITRLGDKQKHVLWYIRNFPDRTDRELTKLMRYSDPNKVRPRRKELENLGFIECSGDKTCTVTGRTALTWRVKSMEK